MYIRRRDIEKAVQFTIAPAEPRTSAWTLYGRKTNCQCFFVAQYVVCIMINELIYLCHTALTAFASTNPTQSR